MAKKKVRNKFRDRLGDYYLTNREITKHYDAEHQKAKEEDKRSAWGKSEKTMIMITIVAIMLIALKYLVLK